MTAVSVPFGHTGGRRRASLVWNEAFAAGKPFPVRKVPIEVWSLGRFKFKGIAGTCKASVLFCRNRHQKLFLPVVTPLVLQAAFSLLCCLA